MNDQKVPHLFFLLCMVIFVIPVNVLAISGSGDVSLVSGEDFTYGDASNNGDVVSIPGVSGVDITGINAANFPYIIAYVTVNTDEGKTGQLKAGDFEIYENGNLTYITTVSFPDNYTETKLDLAIVFDDTGSMDDKITNLKAKVNELTSNISSSNIDCRYSLITFNDTVTVKQQWTSDPLVIKKAVDRLEASGGDDAPEADLDALETALDMGFRSDAQHMILDITDGTTHYRDDGTTFSNYTIPETASHLMDYGISYILVGPDSGSMTFNSNGDKKELVKDLGGSGLFIDINGSGFSEILDKIQSIITQTYAIGYYTPNHILDGKKYTVRVNVGDKSDTGQYSASIIEPDSVDTSKSNESTTPSLSTIPLDIKYGIDITDINTENYPYIISSVKVNTTALRADVLKKENFKVLEDGNLMNITSFSFVDNSEYKKLDLAIVFDDTGSMVDEIAEMKAKVSDLINRTSSAKIDCQYELISFKDKAAVNQKWTSDPEVIKNAVNGLNASDGFDAAEADLDAIEAVLGMGFRSDAQHVILDITDEITHYKNDGTKYANYTIPETASNLINNGTSYILVGPTKASVLFYPENDKRELVKTLGQSGLFIDIHDGNFSKIFDGIQSIITRTYTIGYKSSDKKSDRINGTVQVIIGANTDNGEYSVPI